MDGEEPPPRLRGWKDTVQSRRQKVGSRALRRYRDPNMPYMYHCHILVHEDSGMMGQFVVLDPGQTTGVIDHAGH